MAVDEKLMLQTSNIAAAAPPKSAAAGYGKSIEETYPKKIQLRPDIYDKKVLLDHLELELVILENQIGFLRGVLDGEINLCMDTADLIVQLRDKGFTSVPKKTKAAAAQGSSNETNSENNNSEVVVGSKGGYDYLLLSLCILDLNVDKVEELSTKKDKLGGQVAELKKDLAALDIQLDDEQEKSDGQAEVARDFAMRSRVMPNTGLKATKAAESVPEAKETSNSSTTETGPDNAPEFAKPKVWAAAKKAPARKRKAATAEDNDVEDELVALKDRLNAPEVVEEDHQERERRSRRPMLGRN